jgi:murein hydrolase activator
MKVLALVLLLATPAFAATDPVAETKAALAALSAAEATLKGAETAEDKRAALTEAVAAYERALRALRLGERDLVRGESGLRHEIQDQSARITRLMSVLLRMRKLEDGAALIHPDGTLARIHATLTLEAVTPRLKAEGDRLALTLADLATLRSALVTVGDQTRAGLVRMRWAREELKRALVSNPKANPDIAETLNTVAATSASLDLLIEGITALEGEGVPVNLPEPDLAARFGKLPLPAAGELVSSFGEAEPQGDVWRGATLITAPEALVTAPFDASIRYVGPFLGYGNVIILEPSPDILLVLAGLERVYVGPEEIISEGTALGLMGGTSASDGPDQLSETLYVELRRGGSPVDPAGWFASRQEARE